MVPPCLGPFINFIIFILKKLNSFIKILQNLVFINLAKNITNNQSLYNSYHNLGAFISYGYLNVFLA